MIERFSYPHDRSVNYRKISRSKLVSWVKFCKQRDIWTIFYFIVVECIVLGASSTRGHHRSVYYIPIYVSSLYSIITLHEHQVVVNCIVNVNSVGVNEGLC